MRVARRPEILVILSLAVTACADSSPRVASSLVILPESVAVAVGDTAHLRAVLLDANGDSLSSPAVTWSTADTSVVTTASSGAFVARGIGRIHVSAGLDAFAAQAVVRSVAPIDTIVGRCGLIAGGKAYCWDPVDPPSQVGGPSFATIAVGGANACGLTPAGQAWCWGSAPLGNGTMTASTVPVLVGGGLIFSRVSGASSSMCGLTTGTATYCWGQEAQAITTNYQQTAPGAIAAAPPFLHIASGQGHHVCGLTAAGVAYCWGDNGFGQLGATGASTCSPGHNCSYAPLAVAGGHTFASIAVGFWHSCGIDTAGDAWCWGENTDGPLGTDSVMTNCSTGAVPNHFCSQTPVRMTTGLRFTSLALGTYNTCGLVAGGQAYCWGYNGYGELGTAGSTARGTATPVAVGGTLRFAWLSAGATSYCGKTLGGTVYCWGLGWGPTPVALAFQP